MVQKLAGLKKNETATRSPLQVAIYACDQDQCNFLGHSLPIMVSLTCWGCIFAHGNESTCSLESADDHPVTLQEYYSPFLMTSCSCCWRRLIVKLAIFLVRCIECGRLTWKNSTLRPLFSILLILLEWDSNLLVHSAKSLHTSSMLSNFSMRSPNSAGGRVLGGLLPYGPNNFQFCGCGRGVYILH